MKVVKRPEVRGPAGKCKGCGVTTKSHVLEPASYEEYEIVDEHEMEEHISDFEEENEDEEIELSLPPFGTPHRDVPWLLASIQDRPDSAPE